MSGIRGQNTANGSALKHGGKSLLALVERSQDPRHPVLQIIMQKTQGYLTDKGGVEMLSLMEQDTLKHGAVLAILADLHVHRILNNQGQPRRMNAARLKDLCLGYSRLVDSHSRLLALVGLERRAKELPPSLQEIQQRFARPTTGEGLDDGR